MMDINLFRAEDSIYLKKIKSKSEISKDDSCDGYLIEADEKMARRIVESLRKSGKKIGIVFPRDGSGEPGGNDAFNRRVVETLRVDYLVSPERGDKKDSLKQRDSGINHVVAKLAKEKGVLIVVDFNSIRKLKGKELALRLGRVIQNVKICRKASCGFRIGSFGSCGSEVVDEKGRKVFGLSLGMSTKQSRESILF